jgi:hypothetical protein
VRHNVTWRTVLRPLPPGLRDRRAMINQAACQTSRPHPKCDRFDPEWRIADEVDFFRVDDHGNISGGLLRLCRHSRNVSVVNETGYAIKFLGFNGPDDGLDEWDNELDKTLQNQTSVYVEFDDDDDGCVWNIKVDWANYDESVLWKNVDLCKFNVLRLRYDSGTKTTSFVAE